MNKQKVVSFLKNAFKVKKVKKASEYIVVLNFTKEEVVIAASNGKMINAVVVPNKYNVEGFIRFKNEDADLFISNFQANGIGALNSYTSILKSYEEVISDKNIEPYVNALIELYKPYEPQDLTIEKNALSKLTMAKTVELDKVGNYYYDTLYLTRANQFGGTLSQTTYHYDMFSGTKTFNDSVLVIQSIQRDFKTWSIVLPYLVKENIEKETA